MFDSRLMRVDESFCVWKYPVNSHQLSCNSCSRLTAARDSRFSILVCKVNKLYRPLCYDKWLNFSLTRRDSVLHTRLRLGFCALNDYLYKINCCNSPLCFCGLEHETVKQYFLLCPRFAAQRNTLLTPAAQVCGQAWLYSEKRRCET